jgi:hypothetical protein
MGIYKLHSPITVANQTTHELAFREKVTAQDLHDLKYSDLNNPAFGVVAKIASRLSGVPEGILMQMDIGDHFEVTKLVLGFCTAGLKTGTDASGS